MFIWFFLFLLFLFVFCCDLLKKCAHGKYIITSIVILALVTFICISLYCYHLGAGLYGMAMVKKSWPLNSKHKQKSNSTQKEAQTE